MSPRGKKRPRGSGGAAGRPTTRAELEAALAVHVAQALAAGTPPPPPPTLMFPPPPPRSRLPSTKPYLITNGAQNRIRWADTAKVPPSSGPILGPLVDEFNLPVTTWIGTPFADQLEHDFYRATSWSAPQYRELDDLPALPFTAWADGGRVELVDRELGPPARSLRTLTVVGGEGPRALVVSFLRQQRAVAMHLLLAGAPIAGLVLVARDADGDVVTGSAGAQALESDDVASGARIGCSDFGGRIREVELTWPAGDVFVLDVWCESFPHSVVQQLTHSLTIAADANEQEQSAEIRLPFHCDAALVLLRGYQVVCRGPDGDEIAPTDVEDLTIAVRTAWTRFLPGADGVVVRVGVSVTLRSSASRPRPGRCDVTLAVTLVAYESEMVDLVTHGLRITGDPIEGPPSRADELVTRQAAMVAGIDIPEREWDAEEHRSIGSFDNVSSPHDDPALAGLRVGLAEPGDLAGVLTRLEVHRLIGAADGIDRIGVSIHGGSPSPFDTPWTAGSWLTVAPPPPPLRVLLPLAPAGVLSRVLWVVDSVCEGTDDDVHSIEHGVIVAGGRALRRIMVPPWQSAAPTRALVAGPPVDMVFAGLSHVEHHPGGRLGWIAAGVELLHHDGATVELTGHATTVGEDGTSRAAVAIPAVLGLLHRDRFVDDWLQIEHDDAIVAGDFARAVVVRSTGNTPVRIDAIVRSPRRIRPASAPAFDVVVGWRVRGQPGFAAEHELAAELPIELARGECLVVSAAYDRDPTLAADVEERLELVLYSSSARQRALSLAIRGRSASAPPTPPPPRRGTGPRRRPPRRRP